MAIGLLAMFVVAAFGVAVSNAELKDTTTVVSKQFALENGKNAAISANGAEIVTLYEVPAGKKALLEEVSLSFRRPNQIDFTAVYVLKAGGSDFTTGSVGATTFVGRVYGEATQPDVIPLVERGAGDGTSMASPNLVLNSGDKINIIMDAGYAASANTAAYNVVLSGQETQ